jgi:Zinc finger, C3HC4 type (RING finger)
MFTLIHNAINNVYKTVSFKVAYTDQTKDYRVNPNWTVQEFIHCMNTICRRDFGLEDVDIIPSQHSECYMNQYNPHTTLKAEEGPAIEKLVNTDDLGRILLKTLFGEELHVFFYIRPRQTIAGLLSQLEESVIMTNLPDINESQMVCPICMERNKNILFMPCRHLACCSTCGINTSVQNCPICRGTITERIAIFV